MSSSSQSHPATRGFVFMMRDLERARRYVPPYQQPVPVAAPFASPSALRTSPAADPARHGAWVLDVNSDGDLIARHDSGYEHVLAAVPHPESEANDG